MSRPFEAIALALRKVYARPLTDLALFFEACAALAEARVLLALVPFRRLAARFGSEGSEGPETLSPKEDMTAKRIRWAVSAAARRLPWPSLCLAQAMAATHMCRRRKLGYTLYFGVGTDSGRPGERHFHAWVRSGSCFLTGGDGRSHFQVLNTFESPAGPARKA